MEVRDALSKKEKAMTKCAFYVPLQAKPGKEKEVADFLRSAVPPSSLMNSRRLMGAYPKAKDCRISISGEGLASQQKPPVHVRDGSFASDRNASDPRSMSALLRKQTNSGQSR